MKLAGFFGNSQRPPAFLGDPDAVFAGDRATPSQHLPKEFIECGLTPPFSAGLGVIHHDVGVDIAVAGVTETGELQFVLLLETGGEIEQVLQSAARDDDVLVQFRQAGVTQGIRELAANSPHGFALFVAETGLNEQRLLGADDPMEGANFVSHRGALAVEFNDQMGAAATEALAPGALVRGGERE